MGIVFISYRREDSFTITGHIRYRLAAAFGVRSVYMDVRSIAGGQEFPEHIEKALQHADAQVVVIGPKWLGITDATGNRRLDDPTDFVRHEIEVALQRGIGVVPVLVDGASMPARDKLPESIRDLGLHQAITLGGEPYFDDAIDRLIAALKKYTKQRAHARRISLITGTAVFVAWMTFVIACMALLGTITVLVNMITWPSAVATRIHQYPVISLLVSGILLLAALSSLINLRTGRMSHETDEIDVDSLSSGWRGPRTLISLTMSSLSTMLFLMLLGLVLLKPLWCQAALPAVCPSPLPITRGTYDSNLDMYFIALESGTYEIPGNPQQYTLKNAPHQQIAAVRIDQASQEPFKVVVGVHNLQQGRFGLIIEQVNVVVDAVLPSPHPLNIWTPGAPIDYRTNPYQVTYIGEAAGATLQAQYVTFPDGKVQLAPGESDQLDVQLVSHVRADVQFHVEVVYKSVIDPTRHTLVLPQRFEIVFSDASNWNLYSPQGDGHFAPTQ